MNIQQIIDYVGNTPNNSNPAVLRTMLETYTNELKQGGSGLVTIHCGQFEYNHQEGAQVDIDRKYNEILDQSLNKQEPIIVNFVMKSGPDKTPVSAVADFIQIMGFNCWTFMIWFSVESPIYFGKVVKDDSSGNYYFMLSESANVG